MWAGYATHLYSFVLYKGNVIDSIGCIPCLSSLLLLLLLYQIWKKETTVVWTRTVFMRLSVQPMKK